MTKNIIHFKFDETTIRLKILQSKLDELSEMLGNPAGEYLVTNHGRNFCVKTGCEHGELIFCTTDNGFLSLTSINHCGENSGAKIDGLLGTLVHYGADLIARIVYEGGETVEKIILKDNKLTREELF